MFRLLNTRLGHHALLAALCVILFLPNLGGPSLWDIDEGNNTECSKEMMVSGNWVIPTFNYVLRVDKPALLYWLQIAAFRSFGVNEFSARLPSALASLFTVLLAYEFGRRLFGATTALIGGIVLASATLFCAAAHFANPDAVLNACTLLTLFLFWQGCRSGQRLWWVASGAAAGLGVLAKGPIGVLLPSVISVLFLLWSRQWRLLLGWPVLGTALVCGLVFAPWYARVGADTKGEFLTGFFLDHNVGRFRHTMEGHAGGLYYYPLVLLLGLAPWSAFLAFGLWYATGRRAREDNDLPPTAVESKGIAPAYRFLWCWVGVYLVFFSLSGTKLPNYVLPLYAPLALLTARFLDRWRLGLIAPNRWVLRSSLMAFAFVGVAVTAALLVAGGVASLPFGRIRPIPALALWAPLGVVPVVGAMAGGWFVFHQRRATALVALSASAVVFLATLSAWGVMSIDAEKAPRTLGDALRAEQEDPEVRVIAFHYFQPSLVFYCGRQVQSLQSDEEVLDNLRYPQEVYLFLPSDDWERFQDRVPAACHAVSRKRDLYRNCDVVLVCNR
jgi:4-amino-4-deoxy-L-arabinose transferase-like glycosyltransferase